MPLIFNKAKVDDYLKQVGSVDTTRNIAFESGAQYQMNLDNAEYMKLENENQDLKSQIKVLQTNLAAAKPAKPKK